MAINVPRPTGLKVGDPIFERHRPDCNARVQLIFVEIEPANSTCVHSSTLLLESTDKLDGFDFRRSRDSAGGEDGSERVKPLCQGISLLAASESPSPTESSRPATGR